MTRDDFDRDVRALLTREPFLPFILQATDGREYRIASCGQFLHNNGHGRGIFIHPDDEMEFVEWVSIGRVVELQRNVA